MVELILGGARSGKSGYAERQAAALGPQVVVVVTATASDSEMAERIARHRADRPGHWQTLECGDQLVAALTRLAKADASALILDCLTLWLGQLMLDDDESRLALEVDALLQLVAGWPGPPLLLVSNEVGLGIVPESPLARRFRDEAGRLHQRLAALADKVTLVVAGIPLCIKG